MFRAVNPQLATSTFYIRSIKNAVFLTRLNLPLQFVKCQFRKEPNKLKISHARQQFRLFWSCYSSHLCLILIWITLYCNLVTMKMQNFDPFRAKIWQKSTKGSNRKCFKTGCGKTSRQNSNVNSQVIFNNDNLILFLKRQVFDRAWKRLHEIQILL